MDIVMISSLFFNSFSLILPILLIGLCAVIIVGIWINSRSHIIKKLAHRDNQSLLVQGYSFNRDLIHIFLRIIGLICVGIALLDPRGKPHEIESVQKTKDVMFIVDISRSMLAEDIQPSRLEAVKSFINSFVESTQDFACGLTVFSTNALTLCPLTYEKSTFNMFLSDISHKTVTAGGTSLRSVLDHIASMYEQEGMQGYHTCVLFTDGEDFSGDLTEVAQRLVLHNVKICIIGVGSEAGAPIPFYNTTGVRQGHVKDAQGSVVISHKNDTALSSLAQSLHGIYMPFNHDEMPALKKWLVEASKFQENKSKTSQYDSYAYRSAGIAWLFFIIDWLIP
jgi:Ca-activated chloride channel family protein